jgi:hypothetical protein
VKGNRFFGTPIGVESYFKFANFRARALIGQSNLPIEIKSYFLEKNLNFFYFKARNGKF